MLGFVEDRMCRNYAMSKFCNIIIIIIIIIIVLWEELHDLYFLPSIVWVIKSRRVRWAGHVARERGEAYTGFWWGNPREREHWGDPGVDGRIILRWMFRKWDMGWIELGQDRDGWRHL
jgi:hypothetical protein